MFGLRVLLFSFASSERAIDQTIHELRFETTIALLDEEEANVTVFLGLLIGKKKGKRGKA